MGRWADQKISIAFAKMLNEKSVDDITVINVCEKAGVNRQSFYYHFKDMKALIQYIVQSKLEKYVPRENIYRKWPEYLENLLVYSRKHKDKILNIYNSSYKAEFINILKNYTGPLVVEAVDSHLKETGQQADKEEITFLETIISMTFVGIYQLYLEKELGEDPAKVSVWCAKVFKGCIEFITAKSRA